jgi:hypothetical protein
MSLIACLEREHKRHALLHCAGTLFRWSLVDEFRMVASAAWAEPLGLCGLAPEVDYDIIKFERARGRVLVRFRKWSYSKGWWDDSYLMPWAYVQLVSDIDIQEINTGVDHYSICRVVKKCGPTRVRFDHKIYTWYLQLTRVYFDEPDPPSRVRPYVFIFIGFIWCTCFVFIGVFMV